jgi:hypothetical protein
VPAVHLDHRRTQRSRRRPLPVGRDHDVSSRHHRCRRRLKLGQPWAGIEPGDGPAGTDDVRGVHTHQLARHPRGDLGQLPQEGGPPADHFPEHAFRQSRTDQRPEQVHHRSESPPYAGAGQVGRGRDQHHAPHELGVPASQEQGDGATHGVARHDRLTHAELTEQPGGVVGTILEAERLAGADAPAVAAVIHRDRVVAPGQRRERAQPVEVGRRHPPVQQHDGRRTVRPGLVADEHVTPVGHAHDGAQGQERRNRLTTAAVITPGAAPELTRFTS